MKMKYEIVIKSLLLFYFSTTLCLVHSQSRWEKRVGNTNRKEACVNLNTDYDNGYIITSSIYPATGFNYGVFMKTDVNGTLLWEKVIGNNTKYFSFKEVISNQGIGYIIAGFYQVSDIDEGPMLIKLDSCGEKVWCNYYVNDIFDRGVFYDLHVLKNSNILALAQMYNQNNDNKVFLFCYNQEGEMLWKKEYAKKQNHPQIYRPSVRKLYKFNNDFMISGDCYWAYDTSSVVWLTPMFIKIDSNFNEEWLLPYAYADSILGVANGIVSLSENEFMGYGKYLADYNTKAILMRFDSDGNETGYTIISDDQINPPTNFNSIFDLRGVNDTLFMAAANFGELMGGNSNGEYLVDLSGTIYKYNSRPNTSIGNSEIEKTSKGNYLFGTTYSNGSQMDVLLYKMNDSLESVPFDTIQYNYDSLCPDTILSGDISLDDCMVITDIDEIPTPEEYYSKLKTIPVKAFPNPAKEKITFAFENTDKHKNISLECYNIFGQKVHEQKVYTGQLEAVADVGNWGNGLYFVVVKSKGKILGKGKFVVE